MSKVLKNKRLHIEDKKVVFDFIDGVRLAKKVSVDIEIAVRYVAEHIGVDPDQSNARLANRFATLLETKIII